MRVIVRDRSKPISRMGRSLWVFGLLCCAMMGGRVNAQAPHNGMSAAERGVRATDSTRLAAMTHADLSALDTLLGADLTYTHNDGSRQSKAEFLADLRSRQLVYLGLRSDSVNVRLYGTTALLDGRIWLRARSGTQQGSFTARFLEAYENRRGHWELVAWQSTRLTPIVVEK